MKYLTFALTKGRLASKTLEMLEQLGITCEEMKEKDSRKLVFVNEELKLKFFLAKGPDVPTYVEYGAADIGVVGKDTIVEEGRNVHEVLDLGFGSCRMCVCGPQDAKELLEHREVIRVATKYPKHTSSSTVSPFSFKVDPVSTISTITSESPTIGASSMEPFILMISTV